MNIKKKWERMVFESGWKLMLFRNRWKSNRANGEFWLAWADDSNGLHLIGAYYYKLAICWNHWRMGCGFVLSVSADEALITTQGEQQ